MIDFVLGKALLSLLFYTNSPYLFHYFSQFLLLLFPHFFVEGHLKALGLKGGESYAFPCGRRGVAINFGFPAGVSCFNCPYKIIKIFPHSLGFYKLNSYQATSFLSFQKLFCFGGFIVTTFIMLFLIEN